MRNTRAGFVVLALLSAALVAPSVPAEAAPIACTAAGLIAAIDAANATPAPDTIELPASCEIDVPNPPGVTKHNWYGPSGLPAIASDITIEGNGSLISKTGINNYRFFFVGADPARPETLGYTSPGAGRLTLRNLVLFGGRVEGGDATGGGAGAGMGGAIFNQGVLALDGVTFSMNLADGGDNTGGLVVNGGGIATNGTSGAGGGFGSGTFGGASGGSGDPNANGEGGGGGDFAGHAGSPAAGGVGGAGGTAGTPSGLGGFGRDSLGNQVASGGDGSGGGGTLNVGSAGAGGNGGSFGSGGLRPTSGTGGGGGVGGGGGLRAGGGFGGGGGQAGDGGFGGGGGGEGAIGGFGGGNGSEENPPGGGGAGMGGAIYNMQGVVTASDVLFSENSAVGGFGATSPFTSPDGHGLGGGIFNLNGAVTLTNPSFSSNIAAQGGPDVYNLGYDAAINRTASLTFCGEAPDFISLAPTNTTAGANASVESVSGAEECVDGLSFSGSPTATGDFDGDSRHDVAVGVPGEETGSATNAGAVSVIYGSSTGLTASGDQFLQQGAAGIAETGEDSDEFGAALATGDFNNDGRQDLAVGVPSEDVGSNVNAGAVHVIYGSPTGLTATSNQVFQQNSSGIADSSEANDLFGASLASGDFDNDGRDDLVVGVPGENGTGAVHVLYGSASGVSASGDQLIGQDTTGVADVAEAGDAFGASLASGDFDNDGRSDVAVGIPFETVAEFGGAGAAHVLYGSSTGLSASGDQFLQQNAFATETSEDDDRMGWAVSAGDYNNDGEDDLSIGVPGEDVSTITDAGGIHVAYGTPTGIATSGSQFFHQNTSGFVDASEDSDAFGEALGSGDFDGDGRDDLAVGVPGQTIAAAGFAGAVHIVYGSAAGLSPSGDHVLHQDVSGVADTAEAADGFGFAIASGNFDGGARDDLGVAIRGEDVTTISDAGALHAFYGASAGLTPSGDQFLHQNTSGIIDSAENDDRFAGADPSVAD